MINFKRLHAAVKKAGRSWENVGPVIGLTGNGMRYSIKNRSLSLVKYEKLCKEVKVHPAFIFLEIDDLSAMFYKKRISEVDLGSSQIAKLKAENEMLKEQNRKLQTRLIELIDIKKY